MTLTGDSVVPAQQTPVESILLMEPSPASGYMVLELGSLVLLAFRRSKSAKLLAAVSAAGLLLTPAIAASGEKRKPAAVSVSFDPLTSFTPAAADPKLAASFAGRSASLGDFKFTPAAAKGRPSQVRVAIRAPAGPATRTRVAEAAAATSASAISALTPATYKLGVSVGWRRFAVSGDVAKTSSPNPSLGERETAVVGVNYSVSKRLTGRVAVGAERSDNKALEALRPSDNYSVDVGGAYNITRNIALTGGVRYRIDHDRRTPLADDRQDSQAVYVGTAFKF